MSKKTFTVKLDEELVKELKKRAERDYLTVEELINQVLWRSARSSLRKSKYPKRAEKFVEIFSRYRPYHEKDKKTYYCYKCKKRHRYSSKIGKEHLKHSDK